MFTCPEKHKVHHDDHGKLVDSSSCVFAPLGAYDMSLTWLQDAVTLSALIKSCERAGFWQAAVALLRAQPRLLNKADLFLKRPGVQTSSLKCGRCGSFFSLSCDLSPVRLALVQPSVLVRRASSGVGPWSSFVVWVLQPLCQTAPAA